LKQILLTFNKKKENPTRHFKKKPKRQQSMNDGELESDTKSQSQSFVLSSW